MIDTKALDPREIRYGNLFTYHDKFAMLDAIDPPFIKIIVKYKRMNANIGHIHPIPITPSILEAAGFVLDGTNMYKKDLPGQRYTSELWIDVDNSECWIYTIQAEDCWSEVMLPKCQYLHQLQNLVHALTGTELNTTL